MTQRIFSVFWATVGLMQATPAVAGVHELIQRELAQHTGAARAEILAVLSVQPAQPLESAESARVLDANARGEARILVKGRTRGATQATQSEYRVRYAAWQLGWVAQKRVSPGEPLSVDVLRLQEVNIAEGLAHELRGILLSSTEELSRLEARQTLIEGGVVIASAVRRIPDLRRGDTVRLEVLSGDVRLSTAAQALEPGSVNQRIKVQTLKSKRELVGMIREGGIVEVRL